MASIDKRPGSPFWRANYRGANGSRIKKSTKLTDRTKALKLAMEWEELESKGKEGRLVEAQCRRVVSEIHERVTGAPVVFYTCGDWLNEWMSGKEGTTAPRTMQKYRQVMADFVVHLGDRANLPLNAISGRDVRSFRDALKTTGRAATTINANVRKILSVPFLAAMKAGLLTVNPVAGVESLIDEESGERDVFTEEQIDALLEAAKGDWVGMILIGVHTALRLNDAANITWESVTLGDSALIRIQPSKTKKSGKLLTIPVEPGRLLDWLFSQPQGVGKAPVFPTLAGKGGGGKSGLSKQFKKIMERAGIVGRVLRQGKGVGRSGASLSYHCLRYTCNSAMANAGVSQEVRQEITGQSTKAINTHYTRISEPTLRDAISKISTPRGKSA